MRSRLASVSGVAVALALTFTVSACAQDSPMVVPTEEPATPIFASDEEALAAAQAAYAEYLKAADAVSAEGGAQPERVLPFVVPEAHEDRIAESAPYRERALHTEGSTRVASSELQQYWEDDGIAVVEMYACLDIREIRVMDAGGNDVTPVRPEGLLPFEVSLRSAVETPTRMLIVRSASWSGTSFC
ncbi:hypothetical protein [Salinibacterium sp. ZJ454]|uniref:hypothetical protein n=1 Tax=Salinibacterium sp. ZJ454 TaxID=2708339 RepID=UPI00141DA431|nr:hypothetical protein [Salinibacterium sp. ZJ454]